MIRAVIVRGRGLIAVMAIGALMGASARCQLPMVQEAEDCATVCKEGSIPQDNLWASGGRETPAYWGQAVGDSITWTLNPREAHTYLRFGIRYSYAGASFEAHSPWSKERILLVVVDNRKPIALHVPATGSWNVFDTACVSIPRLNAGTHTLRVVNPAPFNNTDIDTLILFTGSLNRLPAALRKTATIQSRSRHFVIQATSKAPFTVPAARLFSEFERIRAYYKTYMGWSPTEPIPINLIEDARWPDPGATAFQNDGGVYFRAGVMATEQGNWLHEMTHMFYLGHFPPWFNEPSVRTLTILVWAPALYPCGVDPKTDAAGRRELAEGKAVWLQPDVTYDKLNPVLNALVAKYGPCVFRRFFHACMDAGKKGEIDFTPGRWLTKAEIIRFMSVAAGEDVGPLFARWRGFAEAS